MRPYHLVLACSLLASAKASAQPPSPQGWPPTFNVVANSHPEKGVVVLVEVVAQTVSVEYEDEIVQNGVKVLVRKTKYETVLVKVDVTRDIAKSRVITPDGKQLPIDEVWKRMKKNTVVALSVDGNTPAPMYLRALSPETLVIIGARTKSDDVKMLPPPPKN